MAALVFLVIAAVLVAACTPQAEPTSVEQAPDSPTAMAAATATMAEESAATPTTEMPVTGDEATATTEVTPTTEAAGSGAAPEGALTFTLTPGQSKARYRVREQLVNVSLPNDAIGETDQISGSITVNSDGTIDPASSQFVVDLSTLKSDQDRRDNFLRQNVLQTDQYATATFVPKSASGLTWPLAESGEVQFQLVGDLTIRDVNKEVTWDVTGNINGTQGSGLAKTAFTFADFNLEQPRVPVVLSIEDNIVLEVEGAIQLGKGAQGASQTTPAGQQVAAASDCTAPAALTPAMTEGPYYKTGAPERTSLLEDGAGGTRLALTGYVLNSGCQPISNALLDFWQADAQGQYDNAGYGMRGQQHAGLDGRYQLETVVPGEYPGRTPHIHVKIQAPGGPVLTTQVFFPGAAGNQTDQIFDQNLLVNVLSSSADGIQAGYNFVVSAQ